MKPLYSNYLRSKKIDQIQEVTGTDRSIPIIGDILGPSRMASLDNVADLQRLRLERFHCTLAQHICITVTHLNKGHFYLNSSDLFFVERLPSLQNSKCIINRNYTGPYSEPHPL